MGRTREGEGGEEGWPSPHKSIARDIQTKSKSTAKLSKGGKSVNVLPSLPFPPSFPHPLPPSPPFIHEFSRRRVVGLMFLQPGRSTPLPPPSTTTRRAQAGLQVAPAAVQLNDSSHESSCVIV